MSALVRIEKIVNVHEAKTHLSRLLAEVEAGAEIVIARDKQQVARLTAITPVTKPKRQLGHLAHLLPPGKDPLEDGFWDPLPDEELALWNCEVEDPNDRL